MKNYTDNYINDYSKILANAKIGYEFEFYPGKNYPFYKLIELLNRELNVDVYGYRIYHSSGKVDTKTWKIENDTSLGNNGVELISGPTPYVNAKLYLLQVLKILQRPDFSTDDKCSIHINISFDKELTDKTVDKLSPLKLILNIDENFVYKYFPERENNFYAKSVKKMIPFKNFDFSTNAAELLVNSLELPETKYYGVNMLRIFDQGRVEFRYIGGKDYQFKTAEILELMDYFIVLTWNCINEKLTDEDMTALYDYLSENINQFKNFSKLDNFIAEFPSISLQVDKNSQLVIVRTFYEQIYDKLFELITNIYNLNNCIINYNTENQKLEVVDANFKAIFDVNDVHFIDSVIMGGSFNHCEFINCEVRNAHLTNCVIMSDVYKSKIENCTIRESSVINDCYVYNCFMDGKMVGGVFRSGKLGNNAEIGDDVKIVTNVNNYFGSNKDKEASQEDKIKGIQTVQTDTKDKGFKGLPTIKKRTF